MMHKTIAVSDIVVETERFDLRPVRMSDSGLVEVYSNDKRVARMTTTITSPVPPGATEALLLRAMAEDSTETVWAMDATKSGGAEVMGLISLERMDRNQSEVSYWVAPAFWNQGTAQIAVTALTQANPLGNDTIFASVFQDNPASARVLTNLGFEYLGDAESFCVARDSAVATWTYLKKLA